MPFPAALPFSGTARRASTAQADETVVEASQSDAASACDRLGTSLQGLTADEARRRLDTHGPNTIAEPEGESPLELLFKAALNPLVLLLAILGGSSLATGDAVSAAIMAAMLSLGVGLRFAQEWRAHAAVAGLRQLIGVRATALRDGTPVEVPLVELVPGDVVRLSAGDMIPADVRLLAAKDLFVAQAALTGESFPVEKHVDRETAQSHPPLELQNLCWLGTSVASGTAAALVVATGRRTLLGGMSRSLEAPEPPTAFDVGLERFTWLMVGIVAVMVPLVFLINGLTKGNWGEAFLFALAVGVGITPEMLPMIVTVCLSRGALMLARERVIVKHLDAIQNLGGMDVLCTDKTGTLTLDRIILERHCDVLLRDDPDVLRYAWLNSHFQTGLKNLLDRAILDHEELREHVAKAGWEKVDEIPFDFERRVMSVVVSTPDGGRVLVCKGAPEAVYARCSAFSLDDRVELLSAGKTGDLTHAFERLSADGFRVLAVATRDVAAQPAYGRDDEHDLVLRGYVAFLDPPKDSAAAAIRSLVSGGVAVKVLTGDNELVSRKVCEAVGIDAAAVLLGHEVDALDDAALAAAAARATLMARLSPQQKERVVHALRRAGHVVGFLGDGINDAPALRAADVGISVDSAVDIARASADCVLLEKDLEVLEAGVRVGRKVFVNILKYVRMGASSNFGNMLSVLGASVFLPFVPMTPLQILTNNLLYDCSQVPIPTDDVDPELIARPRPWSIGQISRFILLVGPVSSLFDITTFAALLFLFGCVDPGRAPLFHTGWFVESLVTQTFIIHVIRTDRIPFLQSRASAALTATTVAVIAAGVWLVGSPLGRRFGFVPLPAAYWPVLLATVVAYATVTHLVKTWLVRRGWID
ncbi:MAG: magnesium-translocating P-type ATPase [Planctomycetia bacterium]